MGCLFMFLKDECQLLLLTGSKIDKYADAWYLPFYMELNVTKYLFTDTLRDLPMCVSEYDYWSWIVSVFIGWE